MLLRTLLPGVRKIHETGERTSGVVLGTGNLPAGTIGISRYRLEIRVSFPDGSERTVKRYCTSKELGGQMIDRGDTLPMRYAKDDPSKVEIDYAEVRRRGATS